jgi:predicted O-linked N-acetylglucosamine transferase (SPINDLY family)
MVGQPFGVAAQGNRERLAGALSAAVACHQRGDLAEARRLYKLVLRESPNHFDALHLLGVVEAQRGHHDKAVRLIRDALRINPNSAEAHFSRGNVLLQLQRWEDALAAFDKALKINPDYPGPLVNRGNVLLQLGRLDQALACFDRALALDPGLSEALNNRGNVLLELGRFDDALASFAKALEINPDHPGTLVNCGNVLLRLRRLDEALDSFDNALRIDPDFADALNNRGNALLELGRLDAALASFEQAIKINPDFVDALANQSLALMSARRFEAAGETLARLLKLNPKFPYAVGNLWYSRLRSCDWRELEQLKSQIDHGLRSEKRVIMPFPHAVSFDSPEGQLRASGIYARDVCPNRIAQWQGPRHQHDRIRLAYLSTDFRAHATGYVMAELFERHDRGRFETIAISFGPDDASKMRARLEAAFDRFVDVKEKGDREIADLMRDMEIDIAVDLKGFTENARPGIFALRPAPIAVSYMGFVATMGVEFMHYIIADRTLIPDDQKKNYSEQVVHLPDSYWVNDSKKQISDRTPTRAEVGLPEQGFVFCCFNNNYKITPKVFDIWVRLLRCVEGSVLWLFESNPAVAGNLRREAQARGVAPQRLVFAPRMALEDHLARHRLADLFLDTLPCNAHTTATDALWVGLPVLTCIGGSYAGRVCASLLNAIGLPEMITHSLEAYESVALQLATDAGALSTIKDKVARNRGSHPLFDTDRFRRHFEAAFITMWERHQQGEPPASFSVEPLD